ncbi:MAG: hypothetical protein WD426_00650 [Anditalea sp.]
MTHPACGPDMVKTFHTYTTATKESLKKPGKWTVPPPLALCLLLLISGCSILTKSQLDSIKVYAVATQEYAQYPGQLIKDYVEVQNSIFLLTSPLVANPELAAERILSHHKSKTAVLEEAERFDLSFDILKEYAKSLEILSTPDYFEKTYTNIENTGTHLDLLIENYNSKFDKAIPGGLGSLVYQSMVMVGKRYLDHKRGDILKEYIAKGEPVIKEISEISKRFLEEKVAEEWVQDIDQELKSAHSAVRRQILVDTLNYSNNTLPIIQLDTQVAKLYDDLRQLRKLNQSLVTSIDELYLAHHSIHLQVQQKKKLTSILNEVTLFVSEVYEIRKLNKALSQE